MTVLGRAVLLVLLGATPGLACELRQPYGRLHETVAQLATPGDVLTNLFTVRNEDTRDCPTACFQLHPGFRQPHDGAQQSYVTRVRLRSLEDTFFPYVVCLPPGEEVTAQYQLTFAAEQPPGPSYVVQSVFVTRVPQSGNDIFDNEHDAEGTPGCVNMTLDQCAARAYCTQLPG